MNGYKTYIVCAIAVIYGVSGFLTGHLTLDATIQIILAALAGAGLRHGLTTGA
jgi:hypothetical protein